MIAEAQAPETPATWCADYIGIPFRSHGRDRSGCDCYGLVALVLKEQFGKEVPFYADDYVDALECAEIAALIRSEIVSHWRQAGAGAAVAPGAGDAIVLNIAGEPWHVGIVVAPGWFLHVRPGTASCLERYESLRWRRRIVGFYRYAG